MSEVWKDIPGYEGRYQVSDQGNVLSINRRCHPPALQLRPFFKCGYPTVGLYNDGYKFIYVHRLVMRAFRGYPPNGMEVNHIDNNKLNPSLSNLEYVTHKQNNEHRLLTGIVPRGESHKNSKLSDQKVIEIRQALSLGVDQHFLALDYGVSQSTISLIACGRAWRHV